MTKILLIIPAYNESEGILHTVAKVVAYQKKCTYSLDYLVINDGSTDNEEAVLRENGIPHIGLVANLGIGGAVQAGYRFALQNDYDIAIQFDGDGQHDIESISQLIEPILADRADFVVGSRFVADSPSDFKSSFARRAGIRFLSGLTKLLSGFRVKDITSGYRAANRKVIEQFVAYYPSKYPEPESYILLVKQQTRIQEVGVNMFERSAGVSSIRIWDSIGYMIGVSSALLIAGLSRRRK
ncbi:MAG: glycosyltransferase family 2 protein [Streptococcaceae bacterium]|jgi:glycosyltransferase involved in cell wall biosynthesis|nr:glycosyltransferase family 2 protein [Streptococcaceae bacterium]